MVLDTLLQIGLNVKGYFDIEPCDSSKNFYDIDYHGNERLVNLDLIKDLCYFFPTMGDNGIRKKIIQFIDSNQLNQTTIIDPNAIVSSKAFIDLSVYVAPGAIINSLAEVKKGSIINSGATVEHECIVGAYSHIAPNAVLTGNVTIGENTLIGANAVITPGVKIGNNVIIGAGSVVTKDISDNTKWVGNPLKRL